MAADQSLELGQISLIVSDLDTAVAFYRDKVGLQFLFQAPNLAFFDCGGVRLMVGPPVGEAPKGNSVLYFRTPDIDSEHTSMRDRGVKFVGEPHLVAKMPDHELWMAFFKDPEGNLMALMSEKR